jgi:NAD(P)-dependent dehydrogenase (short-subunit alcohol dehydrogenase family)
MTVPNFSLQGKVAIITGASGGVGRALSNGFAESGASLVLAARRLTPLQAVADEIGVQGGKALAVPTDITDSVQVSKMVEMAMKEFGRLDILVNCAGGGPREPTLNITEESWDKTVDFNLKGAFLCSQAAGRVMIEQRSGSIITFSTTAAQLPAAGESHYTAAKAGVIHLTRVLAAEWGRYNVRVNCISPGLIDDEHGRAVMGAEFEKYARRTSLGRAASPEDILGVAIFLASGAASYITGVIMNVNGGPI